MLEGMKLMQPPQIPLNYASPIGAPNAVPPSAEHLQQITAAKQLHKPIRRAILAAKFNGWTIAIFGGLTLFGGVLTGFSTAALLLGFGMCAIAYYEFQGGNAIQKLDPDAPRRLAINQIIFGGLLFVYAGYSMWHGMTTPSELSQELSGDPEIGNMFGGSLGDLEHAVNALVYGILMVVAVAGCGATALYYNSRRKHIIKYVEQTPPWIIDLQRAGMTI
jgi:hypothetical protein